MSTFFKPYEGNRPYVFISYSHRDSEKVLDIISVLNERKLRLWYDEGIPAGSDWPKNIELHMRGCAAVLFFLSATALASPNCYSEIKTAVALKKPILLIPLEPTQPNDAWAALLSAADRLLDPRGRSFAEAILCWKVLSRSFYRKRTDAIRKDRIGFFAAILLLAAAAVALVAVIQGRFDPHTDLPPRVTPSPTLTAKPTATSEPVPTPSIDPRLFPVRFPDKQQENAVRDILGKADGNVLRPELAAVKELYFCGNMTLDKTDNIRFSEEGAVRVNGAKVVPGKVSDLSVIGTMVFLERLALIDQPIKDLSPLNDLVLLKELYLSGNAISDLSSLKGLLSLTTLHIEHTDVRDLAPLASLPSLRAVTVSADMLPLKWTDDKTFKVILVP